MAIYKSNDTKEQMDESINILKKEIRKDYSKNNSEYREIKENLSKLKRKNFSLKINVVKKIFYPQNRRYELTTVNRKFSLLKKQAENIIDNNPRVQLSSKIKESINDRENPTEDIKQLGLFAIEELMQEENSFTPSNELEDENNEFSQTIKGTDRGIGRILGTARYTQFGNELKDISSENSSNYIQMKYMEKINNKIPSEYPDNNDVFSQLNSDLDDDKNTITNKMTNLRERILEEHQLYGVKSGFEPRSKIIGQALISAGKKIIGKIKQSFNNKKANQLPESTNYIVNSRTSDMSNELKGFVNNQVEYSDNIEKEENVPTKKIEDNTIQ